MPAPPAAWGLSPFGMFPWSAPPSPPPGAILPTHPPFDMYCISTCGEMSALPLYTDVEIIASGGQLNLDDDLCDIILTSGGAAPTGTATVFINTAVSAQATLDTQIMVGSLPQDFTQIPSDHVFLGLSDLQGGCAGLFFSDLGIAYTGSVRHNAITNALEINAPLQHLPNSSGILQVGVFYTIRIVMDFTTQTTFIYITESSQLAAYGHQLRFVLPTIASSSCVVPQPDGTYISVKGTATDPSTLRLKSICLGTGLLIPNLPPVADAGQDQSVRMCAVAQLDGSGSFDPEGANLTYTWRLVDGPIVSSFVLHEDDGMTQGTGFTDRLYSDAAASFVNTVGIDAGDVLLFDGTPYDIRTTGTDGTGFYIQIAETSLPVGLSYAPFRILKQGSIANRLEVRPTFYADVPGLFHFDLRVSDGGLFSDRVGVLLNVTESAVPRGVTPELPFIWNYLPDFWRLVENTEQLEVFWSALAQIASSELLVAWQHEYSKSLRDVQRTFQRRWLHYDLRIPEPLPELTTVDTILMGVLSVPVHLSGPLGLGMSGTSLRIRSLVHADTDIPLPAGTATAAEVEAFLRLQLQAVDARFRVSIVRPQDPLNTMGHIRIWAPFPFTVQEEPATVLFPDALNDLPRGSGGAAVGRQSYRVDRSLSSSGVREGDFLVVSEEAYRILRVVSDPGDPWTGQRLVLGSPLPSGVGTDWVICRATTSTFIDFYSSLCSAGDVATYALTDLQSGDFVQVNVRVLSAAAIGETSVLLTEHAAFASYLVQPERYEVRLQAVTRRKRLPLDPLVVEIPVLQEKIQGEDEAAVLRQNIDFFKVEYRGKPCLEFVAGDPGSDDVWDGQVPPERMWAEVTYLDNRPVIEQNFGLLARFTLEDFSAISDHADYLSVVRGLWYTHFNGPTLYNLRVGAQILLGLPFAEEGGRIVGIQADFSSTQSRLLIRDNDGHGIVRSYTYPRSLPLEVNPATGVPYAVGDDVAQFAPLVLGVDIVDYVKDPEWYAGYLSQGAFYEVEKFFKFLVRILSSVFSLKTLTFVRDFILRVKPTSTFPLFVVSHEARELPVSVTDEKKQHGGLRLITGICPRRTAGVYDHPNPSGGGYIGAHDSAEPYGPSPVYPNAELPVPWGYDSNAPCPEDVITGMACTTLNAPTLPRMDSIFVYDADVIDASTSTPISWSFDVPLPAGKYCSPRQL